MKQNSACIRRKKKEVRDSDTEKIAQFNSESWEDVSPESIKNQPVPVNVLLWRNSVFCWETVSQNVFQPALAQILPIVIVWESEEYILF